LGKIFIQSTEDIPKDSEVFYPYGLWVHLLYIDL
jgi:hypothetical protein